MHEPYVDHIGIIVSDMAEALKLFKNLFQMEPATVTERKEVGLRIAHLKAQNIDIELLQYLDQKEGIAQNAMGRSSGINHISLRVKDIHASLKTFQDRGARLAEGFPRPGSHGQVAFFLPETTRDILFEVCESDE